MVDMKYRFTYGDSDLSEFIKRFHNIMTKINWKFSFPLSFFNHVSIFWKKYQFWLKNVSLFRKHWIGKVESFPEPNFDINQGYKIVLTVSH